VREVNKQLFITQIFLLAFVQHARVLMLVGLKIKKFYPYAIIKPVNVQTSLYQVKHTNSV